MKLHLVAKVTIEEYVVKHPSSRSSFKFWLDAIKYTDWEKPIDIKESFNSADLLGKSSERVVFDIGGNNYRMICHYHFGETEVHLYVCWIGTHAEYDKLNKAGDQYTINLY